MFLTCLAFLPTFGKADEVVFCPNESENEAREILQLERGGEHLKTDVLKKITDLQMRYDEYTTGDAFLNCQEDIVDGTEFDKQIVYVGPDDEGKTWRDFLLIFDRSGRLLYVEQRYSYAKDF